ncbi:DUF2141 domain-containing protein [Paracoccus liaowanqingii]|uniref:DUF2141 domain-containing protein n=1 Tax=Paracoccus liaowanqingii TaxID=2560053 RepID=A0A4P7HKU8_9RHOB|nr:DUF2141 domain-containing protein [Paracoccus liaowanqingii]QBX34818.1 DUF2141 domain-containing protein [Paracoccus liaowanqingii]
MAALRRSGAQRLWVALAALLLLAAPAWADRLEVLVTGVPDDRGVVACSLHGDPGGFPQGVPLAADRVPPRGGQARCVFSGVAPGRYAVAVMHDADADGRLGTNVFGIPTEGWGVSGNAAPRLRAPRFDESAFDMGPDPVGLQVVLR